MVKTHLSKVRVADNLSEVSCAHKDDFTQRGILPLKQLNLGNYLLRNSPWKTYWKVQLPDGSLGFAKVNYGYSNEHTNYIMGKKEALLSDYFSNHIKSNRRITVPYLLDHWGSKNGYFVVFKWEKLRPISLQVCLSNPILIEILSLLLRELHSLPPPKWWSIDYEVHNFAGINIELSIKKELSPFGFDLDDNLALTKDGRLYFSDYEFIQWAPMGLQETYICLKILFTSRRDLLLAFSKNSSIKIISRHIKRERRRRLLAQATEAWCEKLLRNKSISSGARLKLSLCKIILLTL